jgi:transcriptional regulator with XRE-family HTH domain
LRNDAQMSSRMNEFKKLRKSVHKKAVRMEIIALVAKRVNKSSSAISRTFSGKTDNPDPDVVKELNRAMVELGIEREFTA